MADVAIASAVVLPEEENDGVAHAHGVKRRLSDSIVEENDGDQEGKRQRISPGKNSPTAARDSDAPSNPRAPDAQGKEKPEDPREIRRKSNVADEKQRSKRLFGALLGSLNQPRDRTSQRRQEIESRRKAELQRQDDERVEDKQRRQARLTEQRKKTQMNVEEENMRAHHGNMLDRANYLQTVSEPRIFYKPWDLRPDEEDRIEEQIRTARAHVDRELDEFDEKHRHNGSSRDAVASPEASKADIDNGTSPGTGEKDKLGGPDSNTADREDQTPAKFANILAKPAEVPESPTDVNTNSSPPERDHKAPEEPQRGKEEVMEDYGEHVEGGDEDSVIY